MDAVSAFGAFAGLKDQQFHLPWLFEAHKEADAVRNRGNEKQHDEVTGLDECDEAQGRVEYEEHVAYTQNHGRAGKALEEGICLQSAGTRHLNLLN